MFESTKIYVKQESVLAVPISAIETDGETKYVFVKTDGLIEIEEHEEHKENENKEAGHEEKEHKRE